MSIQAYDFEHVVSTIKADPAHAANLAAIVSAAPPAVQDAASHDPSMLLAQLASATTTPDWFSKIPTSVANAFITDFAKPNKAKQDFNDYISSAAAQPEGKSLLEAVYAAAPTEVQSLYGDPMGVVVALEASATPVWASDIPAPLRESVGAVYDSALRIYDADLKPPRTYEQFTFGTTHPLYFPSGTGNPGYSPSGTGHPWAIPIGTGYPNTCPTCHSCNPVTVYTTVTALPAPAPVPERSSFYNAPSTVVQLKTSSKSIVAFTPSSTKSVVAFTGAAAPMRTAAAGFAALVAGAGAWLNV